MIPGLKFIGVALGVAFASLSLSGSDAAAAELKIFGSRAWSKIF